VQQRTMVESTHTMNPAEEASQKTLSQVHGCLEHGRSFRVEAGAGAGKTYTLVKALQFLIERYRYTLSQRHQRIACITFTNIAKDEIEARTDRNPLIHCNTIHAFCWSLIVGFQQQLREGLPGIDYWTDKMDEVGDIGKRRVEYELGYRSVDDVRISIHHDDVLTLTIALMDKAKFRSIVANRYPVILIDEYQDADAGWIESVKHHFLGRENSPQFGFFGDHWQKIYGKGCGKIEHPCLTVIGKQANFRSVPAIVDCLNRMRPELPQAIVDPDAAGEVRIFHTNGLTSERRDGAHWSGDLPAEDVENTLRTVTDRLGREGWDLLPESTKILMLTHTVLAGMQGYPRIPSVFRFNESFTRKEHPYIAYFANTLEPACNAYRSRNYGEMFRTLGSKVLTLHSHDDKRKWSEAMEILVECMDGCKIGNVLDHLVAVRRPRVPDAIERRERELREFTPEPGEDMPRALKELSKLRAVPYREITALCHYLSGHSPFETKHGVKGAEFDNVLVVVGRGWNQYNFGEMLELAAHPAAIPPNKQDAFERNRNLFYVTYSRPRKRLAVLVTQQLSAPALDTVSDWFGADSVESVSL